jgi:hypothetical protein
MSDDDRRKSLRVDVQVTAVYRSANLTIDARVMNLSQSGMLLECERVDATGTSAVVELDQADGEALAVPGKVVWSDAGSGGMGIRFFGLARAQRLALANFIVERLYR